MMAALKKCALVAYQSPKKAFYKIQLEFDDKLNVIVTKESGITIPKYKVCDRRTWGFAKDFSKALKFYNRKVSEKLRGGRGGRVYGPGAGVDSSAWHGRPTPMDSPQQQAS